MALDNKEFIETILREAVLDAVKELDLEKLVDEIIKELAEENGV